MEGGRIDEAFKVACTLGVAGCGGTVVLEPVEEGGLTTKIHTAVEGLGNPLRFLLTPGQASDDTQAEPLLQGLPPQSVIADKGYGSSKIVEAIAQSSAKPSSHCTLSGTVLNAFEQPRASVS